MVKSSALGSALRGEVLRSEMREADAKTEDLVVKFLAGLDEQIQTGVVILNIYVPDVRYGSKGRMVEDKKRIEVLESLVNDFIENGGGTEYWLKSDATPTTIAEEEIKQHKICARVHFQCLTI